MVPIRGRANESEASSVQAPAPRIARNALFHESLARLTLAGAGLRLIRVDHLAGGRDEKRGASQADASVRSAARRQPQRGDTYQVVRAAVGHLWHERVLQARRETGTPPAAQAARLDLVDQPVAPLVTTITTTRLVSAQALDATPAHCLAHDTAQARPTICTISFVLYQSPRLRAPSRRQSPSTYRLVKMRSSSRRPP
jgi:hypothetical protein